MKSLLLLLTVAAFALGLGACTTGDGVTSNPNKPVPPGSGGRGDTPGQHAESNPR